MRKYIYRLFAVLLTATVMTSCSEEEGTNPGSDATPSVLIYQYAVSDPYNPDNDTFLRLAANSATREAYYLTEATAAMEENLASMGEDGYMNYVIENGEKVDGISGASNADVYITGLSGANTITVVAVNGNAKTYRTAHFTGLTWEPYGTGYWVDGVISSLFAVESVAMTVTMERAETEDEVRFRFSSPYAHPATAMDDWNAYNGYPYDVNFIDGTYEFVVVIASDGVHLNPVDLGIDFGYGMCSTGSTNGNVTGGSQYPLGSYDEAAGTITFPAKALYAGMESEGLYLTSNSSYLFLSAEAYRAAIGE